MLTLNLVCSIVVLTYIVLSILPCNGVRLYPKKLRKRGEKQSATMVDIAKALENVETSIPSQKELHEQALSSAAEKFHTDTETDAEDQERKNQDEERMSTCELPNYARNYTAACPEGFTQPAWARGSCYYVAGPLQGHGLSLIDFRQMNEADKKAWEQQTCLLFPALQTISEEMLPLNTIRSGWINDASNAKALAQAALASSSGGGAQANLSSAVVRQQVLSSLQGPVSPSTGEIIAGI